METFKKTINELDYFIIAEIGMNHDGSMGNAMRLIEEGKNAGVNAVKFQLHISEEESLINAPKPPYFKREERFEYFKRTAFSIEQWKKLINLAHELDLYFIVSPFSHKAVDILEEIDIDAYKIASGETTNLPLLEYINSKSKPVLVSTGMSNWEEIDNAVSIFKERLIVLFQCSSQYPCSAESVGLNVIKEMSERYKKIIIGYSDHTLTNYSSIGAYLSGAKVFEKHFTLSKKMYGADARFSFEPEEMKDYVSGISFISKTLKNPVNKNDLMKYQNMKTIFEKSIVAKKKLEKGHIIKLEDIDFKKPSNGIRADKYKMVLGKKLIKNLLKDEKIDFEHLES